MNKFHLLDDGMPFVETRGRKPGKKGQLLLKGLTAKRAGLMTYVDAVNVIYDEYSKDLPKVSGNQEKRRKTDIAVLIRELDNITPK